MADVKVTALTAAAAVTTDDLIPVVDDPGGTPTTKKATVDQVLAANDARVATLTNKTISGASNTLSVRIANDVTGLGAGVATFLTTPSSANLRSALTDETGTGAAVFANTPTLVTPDIGAATGTSAALTSFWSTGAAPAASGAGRMSNNTYIYALDSDGVTDRRVIGLTSSDGVVVGGVGISVDIGGNGTGNYVNCAADSYAWRDGNSANLYLTMTSSKAEFGPGVQLKLSDSAGGQYYTFAVSNLAADRTVTLPLLAANDVFVFEAHTQTLTNKTISGASNTLSVRIANDVTGLGTGVATMLGTFSSANIASACTDETGTAGSLVFSNNPSITGPTFTTSIALSGSGLTTTGTGTKGTSYDKVPVNVQTTDATVTTLDSFTLASNTAVTVTWIVTAVKSDLTASAHYSVTAGFKNNAGTVAQVGTTLATVIGESNSAWDCTIDNSTTTIRLRVTGVAATTIQWAAMMSRLDVIP